MVLPRAVHSSINDNITSYASPECAGVLQETQSIPITFQNAYLGIVALADGCGNG